MTAHLVADDPLYDPAEAEKYRRKPGSLTGEVLQNATSQADKTAPGRDDPASQADLPAGQPPLVAGPGGSGPRDDAVSGYIELNDGTILPGSIYTTAEKAWSVFEDSTQTFRRIPPAVVRQIDAVVVWERDEPDWRWKENGSDVKVYTGRTYPARMVHYAFTLASGDDLKVTGSVKQPIYVQPGSGEAVQFILHDRDKGPVDSKLAQLVYVQHVYLGEKALARGKDLAGKRATTQAAGGK